MTLSRPQLLRATIAVTACSLVLSAPAHADKASKRACLKAANVKTASVGRQNATTVVFTRRAQDGTRRFYGCVFAQGKVRRLVALDGGERYRLAGTFVAYVYTGSAIGDESDKIGVLDVRTGRARRIAHLEPGSEGAVDEIDNGGTISAYAVAANGNLVWLVTRRESAGDDTDLELRVADGRPPRERIADRGAIDATSVKLAADGRSVRYSRGGTAQRADLSSAR
ncbi:hypothetical protein DSM112329_03721 [Paraconexibacter sp. AEG42_29]|uniref:Uncharacterized protein n=1 Tax=Paraconexibacter sp. AEG42_29 TaxID=2997339 RepID=A0AAU7AZU8_9ACTN